ncbi:MAG: hypothetical protein N3B18_13140 [Desulfobacterota bacterium]|nr:hypothetical protein [Thermodesulfobacteriota bacterium]
MEKSSEPICLPRGFPLFFAWVLLLSFSASASARDPENCLMCHKYKRLQSIADNGTVRSFGVDPHLFQASVHQELSCIDCHSDIEKIPHGAVAKVDCAKTCHLDRWRILSGSDFSHREVAAAFAASVHGQKPNDPPERVRLKPTCTSCHANDLFVVGQDIASTSVLARCANCHKEETLTKVFTHIAHRFKHQTTRPPQEIVSLCAGCHEDPAVQQVLGADTPAAQAVATYHATLHSRLMQFGATDTAHCLHCHATSNIHDIRRPDDPASSVHPRMRHLSCRSDGCHPGATDRIAMVDSHISPNKNPALLFTEHAMQAVMFGTLTVLFSLMGLETYRRIKNRDARFFRWRRVPQRLECTDAISPRLGAVPNLHRYVTFNPRGDLPRYSIHIVINHGLMALTFALAAATGLPLFFPHAALSHTVIDLLGGINTTRLVHRINAALFTLNCFYHIVVLIAGMLRRMQQGTFDIARTQVPRWKDVCDLYHDVRYFLGLAPSRPRMEKFMYKQKLHYLAMIWGCSVLTLSGCCLLFPEVMVTYLPFTRSLFNVLRRLHGEESLLAVLVILLWHLYNVHGAPGRFPVQWTFWNGKIAKDHQIEEHFLEYERQVREGVAACEEERLVTEKIMNGR